MQYKVRRVATAAGVRRFGQPLHSIITADFVPNFPADTPLGSDHHDIGRRVRYNGPDAPAHNLIDVEGTLVKFRRNNGQSIAEIRDDDGITHVVNVPSGTWSRMSYVMAPIEPSGHKGWEVSTINGTEYWVGMYNRRWYVLKDADFDQEIGKFKTRDEAIEFLDKFAATPRPKNRVSRTRRAKEARDTDFPSLIQEAIVEDADRRAAAGKPKQTAKDRDTIAKPFHAEMQRRGLAFYDTMPLGTWFTPLNDSALKHGTYRKRSKREFISELGVVYSSAHIGPVVRPISARKVLEATLDSVISILRAAETKSAAKVLQGIQDELEEKSIIRHVATEKGVRRYGLPIGAVIVARTERDKGHQLPFLFVDRAGKKDSDGFQSYTGADDSLIHGTRRAAKYRVGKVGRLWKAYDEEDREVASAADEAQLIEALNEHIKVRVAARFGEKFADSYGKRPTPPGMHRPTGAEMMDLVNKGLNQIISRRVVDLFLHDDPNADTYGYGFDRQGKQSMFTKNTTVKRKKTETWATIAAMADKMPDFEDDLRKHWRGDTVRQIAWIARTFGGRIGSADSEKKGTTDPGYGVTQIEAQWVTLSPKSVHVEIPSKKGGTHVIDTDDPTTVGIFKEAMKGKSGRAKLFPQPGASTEKDASRYWYSKVDKLLKQRFGSKVTAHNLRHYRATEEAAWAIQQWVDQGYPMPQSYDEMVKEWAIPAGTHVEEEVLFDEKGQGWRSYISPDVLLGICQGHPEWIDQFSAKYGPKGTDA